MCAGACIFAFACVCVACALVCVSVSVSVSMYNLCVCVCVCVCVWDSKANDHHHTINDIVPGSAGVEAKSLGIGSGQHIAGGSAVAGVGFVEDVIESGKVVR